MSGHEFDVRRSAFDVPQVAERIGPDAPLRLRLTCDLEFDERLLPLVAAAGTLISLLQQRLSARQERHP